MFSKHYITFSLYVTAYFVTIAIVYLLTAIPESAFFAITNLLIMTASFSGMLWNSKRAFSLVKIVYVFVFFFFGVIPLNDASNKNIYWGGSEISDVYFLLTNFFIILGLLSFYFGSRLKVNVIDRLPNVFERKITTKKIIFFSFYALVAAIILYANDFDLYRLLFKGVISELITETGDELSQPVSLIFGHFIRPMPFILMLVFFYLTRSSTDKKINRGRMASLSASGLVAFIIMIFSMLLVAPTGVSRFQAAALYIAMLVSVTAIWNRPYMMQLTILGGLLLVMPFLEKFRVFDPYNFSWSIDLSSMNHGHFDAYQNFARVVEIDFVTYGRQLLGAILFFVPRAVWADKPIGSGAALADQAGYTLSNISMPYMAEGYVNFGPVGVVIFMFTLGVILGNVDRVAWEIKNSGKESLFVYFYHLMLGMIFFMMRGDFMSALAYTVAVAVSFLFIVRVLAAFSLRVKF
jgi:hypothetical protein